MKRPIKIQRRPSLILDANPGFLGGKRHHMDFIFGNLAKAIDPTAWPTLTFIDVFMGGGSVSCLAKALGFSQIFSNDWSGRAQIIAHALLINQRICLDRQHLLWLFQPLPEHAQVFIEATYNPSVLSQRHAKVLDQTLYWANQIMDPTVRALLVLLVWHYAYECVCFPTSFGTSNRPYAEALDGLKSWDSINPKRYLDGSIQRLLRPAFVLFEEKLKKVNRGIFSGSPVTMHQEDALSFIKKVEGDIAYFDPPYPGTARYEKAYAILDHILTGTSTPAPFSSFSTDSVALESLLSNARHIPTWVLSYGNKQLSLDELVQLVQKQDNRRIVQGFAKRCKHMPHVSKNSNNQELLIIARKKQEMVSYAH